MDRTPVTDSATRPRRVPGRAPRLLLAGAGLATAAAAARTVVGVKAVRRRAEQLRVELDHDAMVGEGLGEATELVVLGDSAADGFALSSPRDAFPWHLASHLATATSRRIRLRTFAHDGARTIHVLNEQVPLLRATDADVVAIVVGVNDVFGRRRAASVRADTTALLQGVRDAAPAAAVALVGCPDLGRAPGLPQPLRWVVGRRCRTTSAVQADVARAAGVHFLDIAAQTQPEHFGADGVHPGRVGSLAIARGVADLLVTPIDGSTGAEPHRRRRLWSRASA